MIPSCPFSTFVLRLLKGERWRTVETQGAQWKEVKTDTISSRKRRRGTDTYLLWSVGISWSVRFLRCREEGVGVISLTKRVLDYSRPLSLSRDIIFYRRPRGGVPVCATSLFQPTRPLPVVHGGAPRCPCSRNTCSRRISHWDVLPGSFGSATEVEPTDRKIGPHKVISIQSYPFFFKTVPEQVVVVKCE